MTTSCCHIKYMLIICERNSVVNLPPERHNLATSPPTKDPAQVTNKTIHKWAQ